MLIQAISFGLSTIACVLLLWSETRPSSDDSNWHSSANDTAPPPGRQLVSKGVTTVLASGGATYSGGGATTNHGGAITHEYYDDSSIDTGLMSFLLAPAIALQMAHFFLSIFAPFESFWILVVSVKQILANDVNIFIRVFLSFIATSFATLYILYPRGGGADMLPLAVNFNSWHTAIREVVQLALTGDSFVLDLSPAYFVELSAWQAGGMYMFLVPSLGFEFRMFSHVPAD